MKNIEDVVYIMDHPVFHMSAPQIGIVFNFLPNMNHFNLATSRSTRDHQNLKMAEIPQELYFRALSAIVHWVNQKPAVRHLLWPAHPRVERWTALKEYMASRIPYVVPTQIVRPSHYGYNAEQFPLPSDQALHLLTRTMASVATPEDAGVVIKAQGGFHADHVLVCQTGQHCPDLLRRAATLFLQKKDVPLYTDFGILVQPYIADVVEIRRYYIFGEYVHHGSVPVSVTADNRIQFQNKGPSVHALNDTLANDSEFRAFEKKIYQVMSHMNEAPLPFLRLDAFVRTDGTKWWLNEIETIFDVVGARLDTVMRKYMEAIVRPMLSTEDAKRARTVVGI